MGANGEEELMVSVIITTHNRPSFLRAAVQSVLDQSLFHFELIIVDDASPGDETKTAVNYFFDERIRYIKNEQNLGSTESLNVGLRAAKGEFIAILDDDDFWVDQEKLAKQVKFLEDRPGYVLVATNAIVIDYSTDREISRSDVAGEDAQLREKVLKFNPFAHSSIMYRREAAMQVGCYDKNLPRGKDYDLWLKLGLIGKFAVLPDYTTKYREAGINDRNLVEMRRRDAQVTLQVIKRYKDKYPGFWSAYLVLSFRIFIFRILGFLPGIYHLYKSSSSS